MSQANDTTVGNALVKAQASLADQRLHGKGAKRSKVAAPAKGDGTLAEFAEIEASMILASGLARMEHWVTVGNAYMTQPALLTKYPEALRNALYAKVKLPIPTPLEPKSGWTDEASIRLANTLDVEVSQCRRAFNAMASKFQATVKVLTGKGTYQDKIKQLPNLSKAGRKARQTDGTDGKTGTTGDGKETSKPTPAQSPANVTLAGIVSGVRTMSENDLAKVVHAVAIRCKDSKLDVLKRLGTDLLKALDEYDGTAQAGRAAQKKVEAA